MSVLDCLMMRYIYSPHLPEGITEKGVSTALLIISSLHGVITLLLRLQTRVHDDPCPQVRTISRGALFFGLALPAFVAVLGFGYQYWNISFALLFALIPSIFGMFLMFVVYQVTVSLGRYTSLVLPSRMRYLTYV
ncbi:hypothetical protein GGR54DRAFT_608559 [Hypoxylon sp. NC1633]|nr:hypothetical protein GGR54DRAFT_608559 [Hypoxylon sp. NC1633]